MEEKPLIKPIHVKPAFYAFCYEELKAIAKDYGYNLVLHGSMNRDLDLIAIPWVDEPKNHQDMIVAFDVALNGDTGYPQNYMKTILPGGRQSYGVNINRGGYCNKATVDESRMYREDEQYYIDISVTPLLK
jgi:hypothetical protein